MTRPLEKEVEARSRADRLLGLFAAVRAGEARTALLLTLNVFLVLGAYYTLKVVREPLILTGGAFGLTGAKLKAAGAGAQAVLLLFLVPVYSKIASRYLGPRLLNVVTTFFIACLVGFALLSRAGVAVGLPFYVWLGIFNMMAVAQIWAFAADVYTPDQGKRLFAIVAFGGTAGAVGGSLAGAWLIARVAPSTIMLIAGGVLLASMALTRYIGATAQRTTRAAVPTRAGGFGLVLGSPYLLLVALLILVFTTVNTNGEYILGATVVERAAREAAAQFAGDPAAIADAQRRIIGSFYGGYLSAQSILTAVLQLFVVGRIMSKLSVRAALLILPAISLGGTVTLLALPLLSIIRAAKVLENSTDYSLHNTVRQALFLPVGADAKYKAKQAIDTFVVRFGDVASLGIVALTAFLGLDVRAVATINVALIAVWVVLAVLVGRRHKELV